MPRPPGAAPRIQAWLEKSRASPGGMTIEIQCLSCHSTAQPVGSSAPSKQSRRVTSNVTDFSCASDLFSIRPRNSNGAPPPVIFTSSTSTRSGATICNTAAGDVGRPRC